jgi:hypothetical protein
MVGACSVDGERKGLYSVLVGKPERKSQRGRPRRRWENNIKILDVGVGGVWAGSNWFRIGTGGGR